MTTTPGGGPLIPRPAVVLVTVVILGAIVYASGRGDYKTTIVLCMVLLFILGADVGAMICGWRGGSQFPSPPPTPPASSSEAEKP